MDNLLRTLPVLFGGLALIFSFVYSLKLMNRQKDAKDYYIWVLHSLLILVFIIGYAIIWNFFLRHDPTEIPMYPVFTGLLFLGGIFVYIDTYITKKKFQALNASNQALASANVNMAFLYAQLDELKTNLEIQKAELQQTNQYLKDTQNQMIQMEKMAALGQLIAGIAHEINTPIGAINASSANISYSLQTKIPSIVQFLRKINEFEFNHFNIILDKSLKFEGSLSTKEMREKRKKLETYLNENNIQNSYEIATNLVDINIYEEIEELLPLFKELNSLEILETADSLLGIYQNSKTIQLSSKKISKIVFSLKSFAHFTSDSTISLFNLKQNIENVLILYNNQMKYKIELIFSYDETIPDIEGYPDELAQVWTNLIHNALQAMNYSGTLEINVSQNETKVFVTVTDSGKGIPQEIEDKIFQPFFTTKGAGEGSGLGLHIIKQIVEKHKGTIRFTSKPGKTTFTVELNKKRQ